MGKNYARGPLMPSDVVKQCHTMKKLSWIFGHTHSSIYEPHTAAYEPHGEVGSTLLHRKECLHEKILIKGFSLFWMVSEGYIFQNSQIEIGKWGQWRLPFPLLMW